MPTYRSILVPYSLLGAGMLSLQAPAPPATVPPERRPPLLQVAEPVEQPVRVESARVRAEISGSLALTTVELTLFNPNRRVLEGQLNYPLLDGQTVVRFAIDIEGRLREAVPVEKARAQQVFEEIVRRGIDPGLLERTAGNNYRARIYPLPPRGRRRLALAYLEVLRPEAGQRVYRLPLDLPDRLAKFELELSVVGPETRPLIARNSFEGLPLPDWQERFHTAAVASDFMARGVLEVAIPPLAGAQVFTQTIGERTYFYAEVPVEASTRERSKPRVVGLLWDSSGSGLARDHAFELELLDAYFKALGAVEVRLIRLRDRSEAAGSFKIEAGDWSALRRELQATAYDGGTNLGGFAADPTVDEYLLFSDGLANFGPAGFPQLDRPLHAIVSSLQADPAYLRRLTESSGGELIQAWTSSPAAGAARLRRLRSQLLAVEADPLEIAQVFPEPPSPVHEGFAVAGVLRAPQARLGLRFGFAGQAGRLVNLEVRRGQGASPLAARAWARLKIAALEPLFERNKAEIRQTGVDFGLVTRGTSLLVLDRVEDYLRYQVPPPEELRAEFQRLRDERVAARKAEAEEHLERVVRLFEQRVVWWQQDFPKGPLPKERREADEVEGVGIPRPAAPPPAGGVAGAVASGVLRQDALTVTGEAAQAPAAKAVAGAGREAADSIQLEKWTPDAPYLEHLGRVPTERLYRAYLEERPDHLRSSAFFLDVADLFFERGLPDLGLRILSNLAELELENHQILRILGYRLIQAQRPQLAIPILEQVLAIRPEEPQSYRDLALACAAARRYQRAVDLLWQVVSKPWDRRFPEFELIALAELNALAAERNGLDLSGVDPRLRRNLPLELRVVLTWDADNTDIDLWVTDPNGEKCFYGAPLSYQGGRMSPDFTGGYGPEEFALRFAKPGRYKVEANYYGNRQQIVAGATTIHLTLSTHFGTPKHKDQTTILRLRDQKEVVKVGEFVVE